MAGNVLMSIYSDYKQFYMPNKKDYDSKKNTRSTVSSIAKINKKAPIYITNNTQEAKENLKDIKESAVELFYRLNQATGKNSGFDSILDRKTPESTNEDIATVNFLNKQINPENAKEYDIHVEQLAEKQVNVGAFLPNEETSLTPGVHSFDITIEDASYELQYNVHSGETNRNIQDRLSRLINKSITGLEADVIEDGMGYTALKISSEEVGYRNEDGIKFKFRENSDNSVSYFGLQNMNNEPKNSKFTVNGHPFELNSNSFDMGDVYSVMLHNVSKNEQDTTHIKIADDTRAIINSVDELAFGYNRFLDSIREHEKFDGNKKIISELSNLALSFKENFERIGIHVNDYGHIDVNDEELEKAIENKADLSSIKEFSEIVNKKASEISIDPIKYMDKKIAAYKNPHKEQFNTPYVPSNYSGMFLDNTM